MSITTSLLRSMARNNAWSNYRLLNACAQLTQTDIEAKRTSFFPSIQLTLNHILTVDWYYLDALEATGRGLSIFDNQIPCKTIAELTLAQREADTRLIHYCDRLTDDRLTEQVALDRGEDHQLDQVGRVLLHLFVHQIHHRGQVHAMLSGTSVHPPQLDEFFLKNDAELRADELKALEFSEQEINPLS